MMREHIKSGWEPQQPLVMARQPVVSEVDVRAFLADTSGTVRMRVAGDRVEELKSKKLRLRRRPFFVAELIRRKIQENFRGGFFNPQSVGGVANITVKRR
jgi:hypothetical protein